MPCFLVPDSEYGIVAAAANVLSLVLGFAPVVSAMTAEIALSISAIVCWLVTSAICYTSMIQIWPAPVAFTYAPPASISLYAAFPTDTDAPEIPAKDSVDAEIPAKENVAADTPAKEYVATTDT